MWEEHVKDMTEAEFTLRYRLRPVDFDNLLDILEPGSELGPEAHHRRHAALH